MADVPRSLEGRRQRPMRTNDYVVCPHSASAGVNHDCFHYQGREPVLKSVYEPAKIVSPLPGPWPNNAVLGSRVEIAEINVSASIDKSWYCAGKHNSSLRQSVIEGVGEALGYWA